MNSRLWYFVFSLAFTGCASLSLETTRYDYSQDQKQKNEDAQGALTITGLTARRIGINFKNKSDKTAKIIWDESVIIDTNGDSKKILHGGVKYVDASRSSPPSIVPQGGQLNDALAYADGVTPVAGTSQWLEELIVPCAQTGQLGCKPEAYYGKQLAVLLNVEIDGKKKEYVARIIIKAKRK